MISNGRIGAVCINSKSLPPSSLVLDEQIRTNFGIRDMGKIISRAEVVHFLLMITVAAEATVAGPTVGAEDDKIVGGTRTGLIPFMISVQRSGIHYCGGTLMTYHFTLTACHCLGDFDYPNDGNSSVLVLVRHPTSKFLLQAGDWVLYFNSKRAQRRDAKSFRVHPSCSKVGGVLIYDFALIEVTEPFARTQYVRPVRFTRNKDFYVRRMLKIKNRKDVCWVIGWGKKDTDPSAPHQNQFLKKAKMRFIWDFQCQQMLGIQNDLFTTYNFSENGQVCAVGVNWKESDCTGDSGGPVWCRDSIMALVSYGFECGRGDQPAVYAKIEQFIDWYAHETLQISEREASQVARVELTVFLLLFSNLLTELLRDPYSE